MIGFCKAARFFASPCRTYWAENGDFNSRGSLRHVSYEYFNEKAMKLSVIRQSLWLRINYIDLSPEISDFYRCCIQFFAKIKYRCCGLLDFRLLSKIYVDKSGSFDYNTKAIGVWLSLVERLVRDQEAGGSSPLTPTMRSVLIGFDNPVMDTPHFLFLRSSYCDLGRGVA